MKKLFISKNLFLLSLLLLACNPGTERAKVDPKEKPNELKVSSNQSKNETKAEVDTCNSVSRVKSFLNWYRINFIKINSIRYIKMSPNEPYRIDFKQAEIYLAALRKSGQFSNNFITNMQQYLKKGDKYFIQYEQYDGPPIGFEADLFLYCNDYDYLLNNINSIVYKVSSKKTYNTIVEINLENSYNLKFGIDNNCQIESISPSSPEVN